MPVTQTQNEYQILVAFDRSNPANDPRVFVKPDQFCNWMAYQLESEDESRVFLFESKDAEGLCWYEPVIPSVYDEIVTPVAQIKAPSVLQAYKDLAHHMMKHSDDYIPDEDIHVVSLEELAGIARNEAKYEEPDGALNTLLAFVKKELAKIGLEWDHESYFKTN